ncbi:MAG TPA: hypothetical protein VFA52_04340 [Candidatus Paceibacterota bacterium]|jgi:frataxin-like iron-binding protein CyaY|nr:hypothetical protein [Candidatus Paceibacterota bacterium]
MNNLEKAYIITYVGRQFFLLKPNIEDINILDIGHSLAMQCRWTGHTKYHYSIAQHSWYCSYIGSEEEALYRLLHDASEAYLGDMNRPLKHFTEAGDAYREVEKPLQSMIYKKFGLEETEPESVKIADNMMLYAEKAQLLNTKCPEAEIWLPGEISADVCIHKWLPEQAEEKFLQRFYELYTKEK